MTNDRHIKTRQRAMLLAQRGNAPEAIKLFKKILKNNKQDIDASFMLGALYGMLKKYEDAMRYSAMAVNLSPDFTHALFNLALAHAKLEHPEKAIPLYEKVLSIEPTHNQALYDLGYLYLNHEEYIKAAKYLLMHVMKNNANADAFLYLGQAYEAIGDTDNAQNAYKKAIRIDGKNIDYWLQLSHLHQSIGDLDEAETCYTKALQLDRNNTDAISGIAGILEKRGAFEQAMHLIEPLIKRGIFHAHLGFSYYNIARHTGNTDDAITYLEKVVKRNDVQGNICLAQNTLAKAYDSQKRYDEAFHYFEAANTTKNKCIFPEDVECFTNNSINFFTTDFFNHSPGSASDSDIPVFIVGMPRSGTTLVEQIISCHSLAHGAGELSDIGNLKNMPQLSSRPENQYPQLLKKGISDKLRKGAQEYIEKLKSLSSTALRVTDKMPHNFQYLGLISILFPKAKIIHCKRNPLDNCLSIYFHQFNDSHSYAKNLAALGKYHRMYQRLMEHWEETLPIPIFNLQYEELVKNQETISKNLIGFCGLDWEENCLQFHKNKREVKTFSYDQVRKPIYTSSTGKWKHYEKHLGPLINALGLDKNDLHSTDYIRY